MASLIFPENYGKAESTDIPMIGFQALEIATSSSIGDLDVDETGNWSWLPIPIEGVSTGYAQGWEEGTGNMAALAVKKGVGDLWEKITGGGGTQSNSEQGGQKTSAGSEVLENIGGIVKELAGAKLGTGVGITRRLLEQSYVSYSGPGYRSHEFSFSLKPKSKSESETIEKIILFFKKHSAPTLLGGDDAPARLYKTPHLFQIKFAPDAGLFKIGASACTSIGVKYGGEKYNTFKDSDMPVQVDLSLSFKEMIIHDSTSFGDH